MKNNTKKHLRAITALCLLSVVIGGIVHSQNTLDQMNVEPLGITTVAVEDNIDACAQKEDGSFDCTSEDIKAKVYESAKTGIKWHVKPESPMEKLSSVCEGLKVTDPDCPKILKAMATQESYFGKVMVGDGGKSHGWFHIQTELHKISKACANDLVCSSTWTLKRMIRNGFLTANKWTAVGSHNSFTPKFNQLYVQAVKRHLAMK